MENTHVQPVRQRRNVLPSRSYDQVSQKMNTNILSKPRRLLNFCQIYLLRLLELFRWDSGNITKKLIILSLTLFCAHQYHLMSRDNQYVPPSKETDAALRVRDVQYVPPLNETDATLVVRDKQNEPPSNATDDPLVVLDNQNVPPSNQENETFTFQDKKYLPPYKPYVNNLTTNKKFKNILPRSADDVGCLYFDCSKDVSKCDNYLPTDYDGTTPPCCVHILRDMTRAFDESMQRLGLDYATAFGTLLGLIRSDRLIPWTGDSDYIIPSGDVMVNMVERWDSKAVGLEILYQGIPRVCATAEFEGGKLQRWIKPRPKIKKLTERLDNRGHPYIDLYTGDMKENNKFSEYSRCTHDYSTIFPTKRMMVYNNTFAQNIPADPEKLLITYYGKNWRTPPVLKCAHGSGRKICSYT